MGVTGMICRVPAAEFDALDPDALDYLVAHFATLRAMYRDDAAAGDYVLVKIG